MVDSAERLSDFAQQRSGLPQSISEKALEEAAVSNAQALYSIQNETVKSLVENYKDQEKIGSTFTEMNRSSLSDAVKSYSHFVHLENQQAHLSFWQKFFSYFATVAMTLGSIAAGQPALAAISIALLIAQKTGGTKDLEKAIGGNHAWARLLVGVAIIGLSAAAGSAGTVGSASKLGMALMAGASALGSVDIQSNVKDMSNSEVAMGVNIGSMILGLFATVGGGVMMAKTATSMASLGEFGARMLPVSMAMGVLSTAAESSTSVATGIFTYEEGNVLKEMNIARARSEVFNALREMQSSEGGSFTQEMQEITKEAMRESMDVSRGMSKAFQFAAHQVASA